MNEISAVSPYIELPLSRGLTTKISPEDFALVGGIKWCAQPDSRTPTFYAVKSLYRNGKWKQLRLHRVIMNAPQGMEVDHINGDSLDNRRENLRICSHAENMRNMRKPRNNTSGFKGTHYRERDKKFQVQIGIEGITKHVGYFKTAEEAAAAYDAAAIRLHGEFARTNQDGSIRIEKTSIVFRNQ